MGASNALKAYALYANRVPPLSMQLLAYMALVSKDTHARPWYGQGHKSLALGALGRQAPVQRADVAAVERGVSHLLAVGAIYAERRASGNKQGSRGKVARYRLNLDPQLTLDIDECYGDEPVGTTVDKPQESIHSRGVGPRNSWADLGSRPTEFVGRVGESAHEIRGTKEETR